MEHFVHLGCTYEPISKVGLKDLKWLGIRFPCPIISGSTLLVMIGFGLAPVYTGAMSIVWNFSSSFWSGILFLPVFRVVCSGGDGGTRCHKTHCVAWNVFFPSIVSSKTSMLSNEESIIRPGVYGDIPVGIYVTILFISIKISLAIDESILRSVSTPTVWPAAWKMFTFFSERVAWWRARPRLTCFGVHFLLLEEDESEESSEWFIAIVFFKVIHSNSCYITWVQQQWWLRI